MIELLHAAVALLAVLCMLENMSFADIAKELVVTNIETNRVISFELCFPLHVDSLVSGVSNSRFIGIFDYNQ